MNLRFALTAASIVCALSAGCDDDLDATSPDAAPDAARGVDSPTSLDAPDVVTAPDIVTAPDVVDAPPPMEVGMDVRPPCRAATDCASDPAGRACDVASGRCVACVSTDDTCPATQHCDDAVHQCVDGCRRDEGCVGVQIDSGLVRDATDDGGDASGRPMTYCEPASHACVECLTNAHCPAGTVCVGHACVPGCSDALVCGFTRQCCAGGCVDPATDTAHCGACGRACAFPHAAARCVAGACAMGACEAGFADCDGSAANGCEVDTRVEAAHCGACGAACSLPNATPTCQMGACAPTTCAEGFGDCNRAASDGCETPLGDDVANCGACGRACPAAKICSGGVCYPMVCCAEVHGRFPSLPTGVYPLAGPGIEYPAYCDMSTDGGGWTLTMMLPSTATPAMGYDADVWTDVTLVNPEVTDPTRDVAMKSQAYFSVPVLSEMRFCVGSYTSCVSERLFSISTQSAFLAPETLTTHPVGDFSVWGYTGGLGCSRAGFNVVAPAGGAARCHYGLLLDRGATCGATTDNAIGLGCRGGPMGTQISAGQGDAALALRRTRGWILVR